MARPVDPARHRARRLQVVDAALTVFAERGYDGATTAAICRRAGIGSGTLFHYFPTKLSILLAVLELGTREVEESAAGYARRPDALAAALDIVGLAADEATDPRVPGFVRAVAGVVGVPQVRTALDADVDAQRRRLLPVLARAQREGQVRDDLPAERLTSWLLLFTDGFLERVAVEPGFSAAAEKDLLVRTVREFLLPRRPGEGDAQAPNRPSSA